MSNRKVVHLQRKEPQNNLPEDIRKNAKIKLSSVFVNRQALTAFPNTDKARLVRDEVMPRIISADPKDSDYYNKLDKYWQELSVEIPSGGRALDISLRDTRTKTTDNGEDVEVPVPVNPEDYCIYQFAKRHPQVAENKSKAVSDRTKKFWIVDPDREKKKQRQGVEIEGQAWEHFLNMKDDEDKLNLMLRVFANRNPDMIDDIDEKIIALKQELENRPAQFIDVAQDEDLEKRDFILQCIEHGVLRRVGNQIMHLDEVLGEGIEEVIAFLKNKKNSSTYNTLKAKLKEARP